MEVIAVAAGVLLQIGFICGYGIRRVDLALAPCEVPKTTF
jgi:hypothetical protein